MAPTNVFFSPAVRTEQMLFEDLIIEGLRMYGQDVLYIPRVLLRPSVLAKVTSFIFRCQIQCSRLSSSSMSSHFIV